MGDLVKSVLGGGWSLAIGWILPVFLSLQLISCLLFPSWTEFDLVTTFLGQTTANKQITLLAIASVAGLTLAAAQAPLYRILEGYMLWPQRLADRRIEWHRRRRTTLTGRYERLSAEGRGVRAGLLYERVARCPVEDRQFAPTALGNAIRRFETYSGDRYQLDSQLMWHDLIAAAPERAVAAADNARTNVDFFVCLIYGGTLTSILGVFTGAVVDGGWRSGAAFVTGTAVAFASYHLALVATDEWYGAVRAVVDHGRLALAEAFGLGIPSSLEDERLMWRAVGTLVRRPYKYSESKDVAIILARFKKGREPS